MINISFYSLSHKEHIAPPLQRTTGHVCMGM